jgi:hypothetical protein
VRIATPVELRPDAQSTEALMWVSDLFEGEHWHGAPWPMPEGHDRAVIVRAFEDDAAYFAGDPCAAALAFLEPDEDAFEAAGEVYRRASEAIYGHHDAADWSLRDEPPLPNREQRRRAARRAAARRRR